MKTFFLGKNETEMGQIGKMVWDALMACLQDEDALLFYDLPIFGRTGIRSTADIVIVHRSWGFYTIQIKGWTADNVNQVDDNEWILQNPRTGKKSTVKNPRQQAQEHLRAIIDALRAVISLNMALPGYAFVALPYIAQESWVRAGFDRVNSVNTLLFEDDLEPTRLKNKLMQIAAGTEKHIFSDNEWEIITNLLMTPRRIIHDTGEEDERAELEREMPSVFISYRRADSAWPVRYIADYLLNYFNNKIKIFLDVDVIGFGERFDRVIEDEIKRSNVILVAIGPQWLRLSKANGMRRLDDPNDYVAREIAAAIANSKKIIPVLIDGAEMPSEHDLPEAITDLALYHGFKISAQDFHQQITQLVKRLDDLLNLQPNVFKAIDSIREDIKGMLRKGT